MAEGKKEARKSLPVPIAADLNLGVVADKLANMAEFARQMQTDTGMVSPRSRVAPDGQIQFSGVLADQAIRDLRAYGSPRETATPGSAAPPVGKVPAVSPRTPRGSSAVAKAKGSPRSTATGSEPPLPAITPRSASMLEKGLSRLKSAISPRPGSPEEKRRQEEEAARKKARKEERREELKRLKQAKEEQAKKEKQEKKEKKHHRKTTEPKDKEQKQEKKEKRHKHKHKHKHKTTGTGLPGSGSESDRASASDSETGSASVSGSESDTGQKGNLVRNVSFRIDQPPAPPSNPSSEYNRPHIPPAGVTPLLLPKSPRTVADVPATYAPEPLPYTPPPAESLPPISATADTTAAVTQQMVRVVADASTALAATGELNADEQARLTAAQEQLTVDLHGAPSPEVVHAATKRFFNCAPAGMWCTRIGKALAATLIVLTFTVVGGIACGLLGGFLGSLKGGPAFPFTGTAGFFIGLGIGALASYYAGVNVAAKVVYGKILPPFSCCFRSQTDYQQVPQQLESFDPEQIEVSPPIRTT